MQKRVTPFSLSGVSVRHSLRHDVARHASDQRNEAGTNDRREKPPRPQNREARQHYRDRRAGRSAEARQRHRSMPCIAAAGNPPRHSDDVVRRGQFSPRRRHPREQRTSLRLRRIGRRSCLHPRLSLIARTSRCNSSLSIDKVPRRALTRTVMKEPMDASIQNAATAHAVSVRYGVLAAATIAAMHANARPNVALVCSVLTSTVKSGGSQTRPCSLPRAWVLEPVTEYKTHGCRAGLPEARTVTRAIYIECACTSMGSEDHVCSLCRNGRH